MCYVSPDPQSRACLVYRAADSTCPPAPRGPGSDRTCPHSCPGPRTPARCRSPCPPCSPPRPRCRGPLSGSNGDLPDTPWPVTQQPQWSQTPGPPGQANCPPDRSTEHWQLRDNHNAYTNLSTFTILALFEILEGILWLSSVRALVGAVQDGGGGLIRPRDHGAPGRLRDIDCSLIQTLLGL